MSCRISLLESVYNVIRYNIGNKAKKMKNDIDLYFMTNKVTSLVNYIFKMQDNYCTAYNKKWMMMPNGMKQVIVNDICNIISKSVFVFSDGLVVGDDVLRSMSFGERVGLLESLYELLQSGGFEFTDRMFFECLCRIYALYLLDYNSDVCDAVYLYNVNDLKSIGYGHFPKLKQLGYRLVKDKSYNVYYQKYSKQNIPRVFIKIEMY